jgi:hypothetical protein
VASIAKYGGRYLVRGGASGLVEGGPAPKTIVIVGFPTLEIAKEWYESSEYALNIRQSTLSPGLRDLEYQLGAVLFERANGRTRSIIEGPEFLEDARRVVEETEAIIARL